MMYPEKPVLSLAFKRALMNWRPSVGAGGVPRVSIVKEGSGPRWLVCLAAFQTNSISQHSVTSFLTTPPKNKKVVLNGRQALMVSNLQCTSRLAI